MDCKGKHLRWGFDKEYGDTFKAIPYSASKINCTLIIHPVIHQSESIASVFRIPEKSQLLRCRSNSLFLIQFRKPFLKSNDLRQVMQDHIGIAGITPDKILMVVFSRIKSV